ncbi:HIT-like domain-containing protein [Mycena polygramma]|nr:HIT-like domain-containing protein [Mycena polygramma]
MATNEEQPCLFCGILKAYVEGNTSICHKVYETEHSFAFLDIMPVSKGHTQVIPKYHAKTLTDLPDEYLQDIGPVIKKVALSIGAAFDVKDYNIIQNNGKLAFQHVGHVHFHVVPKPNESEGLVLSLPDSWPMKKVDAAVLAETCASMRKQLEMQK